MYGTKKRNDYNKTETDSQMQKNKLIVTTGEGRKRARWDMASKRYKPCV